MPAPNLDDRRFQDLVDDAKRLVQRNCPEWTDHNVSDPGVTLIETFAYMVDQLLFRVNRIPERHYARFLDLVGLSLHPPAAAEVDVTFWLSHPQPSPIQIPVGTEVATVRTEVDDPIVFTTVEARSIPPCTVEAVLTRRPDGEVADVTGELQQVAPGFRAFQEVPQPGDELLIGLDAAVGGCVIRLEIAADIEGVGVDPTRPPLRWEAWDGDRWTRCHVDADTTGGFNTDGEVVLHVPRSHSLAVLRQQSAGWLRCRVVEAAPDQPAYSRSPMVRAVRSATIAGTGRAVHATVHRDEIVGVSEGVPAQRFRLAERPVVPGDHLHLVLVGGDDTGWVEWLEVSDFSLSGPEDRHIVLDHTAGEVVFGPAVRTADGGLAHHGAVPPKGHTVMVEEYRSGGGLVGNVAAGALQVLRSSVPFVDRVENRGRASGGVDTETVEEAKARAPIFMRTRGRAVTYEDYEELAREATPEVARARCITAGKDDDGSVRVLIVPQVAGTPAERRFEQLIPSERMLRRVADHLEPRRVIGARVRVQPAVYQGVTVVVDAVAAPGIAARALRERIRHALTTYLDPHVGGPGGRGWPFGRPLQVGEVYAIAQGVPGVDIVADARLFPADPISGDRGTQVSRVVLDADTLLFGFDHQIRVVAEGDG